MTPRRTAEILVVGKEIVTGHRQDANVRALASYLVKRGFEVRGVRMVPDGPELIAGAVRAAREGLLVITGGLGSTRDDLTLRSVAGAVGRRLVADRAMKVRLLAKLARRGVAWAPRHRAFTVRPDGARPIENPAGLAEGIFLPGSPSILLLPGVPAELQAILASGADAVLADAFGALAAKSPWVVGVAGLRETEIEDACLDLPPFRRGTVSILPSPGTVQLVLPDARTRDAVIARLGRAVYAVGEERLEEVVFRLLASRSETLATAESCTGGLLASLLTELPGISSVYRGGAVSYANAAKETLLGVPRSLLVRHGAVSAPVARAMAAGIRERLDADWAVAITGIAGPSGGTRSRPVGTVQIATAGPRGTVARKFRWGGTRAFIRRQAVSRALDLLRRAIEDARGGGRARAGAGGAERTSRR